MNKKVWFCHVVFQTELKLFLIQSVGTSVIHNYTAMKLPSSMENVHWCEIQDFLLISVQLISFVKFFWDLSYVPVQTQIFLFAAYHIQLCIVLITELSTVDW